jgi:hypothetical protein
LRTGAEEDILTQKVRSGRRLDEELHNFYPPREIRMIKPRTKRWAGYAERIERRGMYI